MERVRTTGVREKEKGGALPGETGPDQVETETQDRIETAVTDDRTETDKKVSGKKSKKLNEEEKIAKNKNEE